jgi:hypothetical protein
MAVSTSLRRGEADAADRPEVRDCGDEIVASES